MKHLQTHLEAAETQEATYYSTAERLEVIPCPRILVLLKRGQLLDDNLVPVPLREQSKGVSHAEDPAGSVSGIYSNAFFSHVATVTPRVHHMAPPALPVDTEVATRTNAAPARPDNGHMATVATVLPACATYNRRD